MVGAGYLAREVYRLSERPTQAMAQNFVPVPDYVDRALASMQADNSLLTEALTHQLKRQTTLAVPAEAWADVVLDDYYRMNIQVVDDKGKVIDRARSLHSCASATAISSSKPCRLMMTILSVTVLRLGTRFNWRALRMANYRKRSV